MKKAAIILLTIFAIAVSSCGTMRNQRATDTGVVINGVRWATRNVDAPGTFARNPENAGMLYQWNRKTAWTTTDNVTGWDSSIPDGETWESENNPCPPGWRVPTEAELYSLKNSVSIWTTRNGVNGRLFGTAPNQIFLPAAGWRNHDGIFDFAGAHGGYWSSTQGISACDYELAYLGLSGSELAYMLKKGNSLFARDFVFTNVDALTNILNSNRERGFSVRCVSVE